MIRFAYPKMSLPAKWLRAWLFVRAFCVLILGLALSPLSHSWQAKSSWNIAASALVSKALARGGQPSAISLTVSNASSLSASNAGEARRAIESELAARRVRVVKAEQAVADLRVTLSENAAGLVWIAEIVSGPKREVVMTEVERSEVAAAPNLAPSLILRQELVWSQFEPMLDFATWGENRSRLLVLEPRMVALYRLDNSRWLLEQSQPIAHSGPWPLDVRGRLLMTSDHKFEAFLPGEHCTGAADPGLTLECRHADDPWPLAGEGSARGFFSASRNFFTGVLTGAAGGKTSAPFFSAANVQAAGRDLWVFAGTDGRTRQFEAAESELRVSWGSNLVGVKSGCGAGWQILATGTGDWTQRDVVAAFELGDGAAPVASAVEVAGPITAAWPSADSSSAAVVARNSSTGRYEAFNFAISCR